MAQPCLFSWLLKKPPPSNTSTSAPAAPPRVQPTQTLAEIDDIRVEVCAALVAKWDLPPRIVRDRGAPTYEEKWIDGLYLAADKLARMQFAEPRVHHISATCPKVLKIKGA